ncbi:MAG TPA: FAD-dependent oxidoreductase [Pyrinomonadaceae bacterium]|jgi:flavin-dependent dehydrogenase
MNGRRDIYDALIVGGGPAGASAAIHLAQCGARVLLVEREKFPRAKLCGEFISPECLAHFRRLGVLDRLIEAGGAQSRETVFYSCKGGMAAVPSEWFGTSPALGLSRAEMDYCLLSRARHAGVEVLEEAQALGLLFANHRVCGVRLRVNNEEQELSSLVTFDATGRARYLARRVKARDSHRAHLVAFKAHLENACCAEGACEIYFFPGGYGGLSRVERGLSNLCFIASARDVRDCQSDPEIVLRQIVMQNPRAALTLAEARPRTPWLAVAIESFGRQEVAPSKGLIAVGDAASFIDPFTGSGILMALESGELAAAVLGRWLPSLRRGKSYHSFTNDYRSSYNNTFNARLRLCAWLRRLLLAPHLTFDVALRLLNASERLRRGLAHATRRATDQPPLRLSNVPNS